MSAKTDLDFNVFWSLAGSTGRGFRGCRGFACSALSVDVAGFGGSIVAVLRAANSCGSSPEVAAGFALDAKAPKEPNLAAPPEKPPGKDGLESSPRIFEVEKSLLPPNSVVHGDATPGSLALHAILGGVWATERPWRHAAHTNGPRCCHACVLSILQMTQIGCS